MGKTITTIFPSIKAIGENKANKLFYLTAKTITRTAAYKTITLLKDKGLRLKKIIITAKEKLCQNDCMECNPSRCEYANGHFDRVNDAIYDIIMNEDVMSREVIIEYANKHRVCAFEFCLDVSLFCDSIICDYNYLFDPHVYLKRYFSEAIKEDYVFLIDPCAIIQMFPVQEDCVEFA